MSAAADFYRLDNKSGRATTGSFNVSHHIVFGDVDGASPRRIREIKDNLIRKWNRIGRPRWHYWLV